MGEEGEDCSPQLLYSIQKAWKTHQILSRKGERQTGNEEPSTNQHKGNLIKAYPDHFEGIGKFPCTYHIYLKEDAIPVIHAPRKCPIAIRPLVDKKLDTLLEQEVIIPVTESTGIISHLLMEGRWRPQDLSEPNPPEQSHKMGPLRNTFTQGNHT